MKTVNSAGVADTFMVSAKPGYLEYAMCANTGVADLWFCLVDKATAPVHLDVPLAIVAVPAGTNNTIECGKKGLRCNKGIALCVSTAAAAVTLPTTTAAFFTAEYS